MVNFIVSFSVSTALLSLDELVNQLGEAGPYSHTIGVTDDGGHWSDTVWQIESQADSEAGLAEHVESIWDRLPMAKLQAELLPDDHRKLLTIAAFFDDAMNQINIGSEWLREFADAGIDLEMSCYPCDFGASAIPSSGG